MFAPTSLYAQQVMSPDQDLKSAAMEGEGICSVCGDRSAGRHYGTMACYGCKGFFRRTIRSQQTYNCRFQQKCIIDKDQRNACRFCRFQRCLSVGMEPDAIRPDRDVIGKQKNPRRKKIKREDSSLPSPGSESPSQADDGLLGFLADVEQQSRVGPTSALTMPIGIQRMKQDPDFDISSLFVNKFCYQSELFGMTYGMGRSASVEQFTEAMRRYAMSTVGWVDAMFGLASLDNVVEKVALLKAVFAPYTLFCQAARTAQVTNDADTVCLCNGSTVSRTPARHLLDTNLLANNIMARVIDDLIVPIRKHVLVEEEIILLTALIILDPDASGISEATSSSISMLRDRVQNALFQLIRERSSQLSSATCRFGNLLLILPPLAKLSSIVAENVQFAKMFGSQGLDPLVDEILGGASTNTEVMPSLLRERSDATTQTAQVDTPPFLPSDLIDNTQDDIPVSCNDTIRSAPVVAASMSNNYNFYFNGQSFTSATPGTAPSTPYPPLPTAYAPQFFGTTPSQFRFM